MDPDLPPTALSASPIDKDRQVLDRPRTIRRIANVLRELFYGREPDGEQEIPQELADRKRWLYMANAVRRVEWTFEGERKVLWWTG